MSKFEEFLDKKYTKISLYAIVTIIISFVLCIILTILLFGDGNIINPKLLNANIEIHPLLFLPQ
ncbi:MAG: hypothetical protein IJI45_01965 [Anaerolineaceae bacterium]|nr:hypothetical protein [Anaerolineaceae bacterium]